MNERKANWSASVPAAIRLPSCRRTVLLALTLLSLLVPAPWIRRSR